ncbi:rod shape-determining protein MreC [Armatimonas sp.]|uniref:rod shape-determining protein MreC n=1 Tax=Armatimonas sp. TaxID=1872638 RepID=UPI00286BFE2C|nr:rod shape-determining protein MreC [Armatimonas sp.]
MGQKRLRGGWNPRVERRGLKVARGTVIGMLLVGAVGLGILNNRLTSQGKSNPIVSGTQAIALPAQVAAARTKQGVSSTWRGWFGGVALERENEALAQKVSALTLEVEKREAVEAENIRLRGLLDIVVTKNPRPQVAEVVAWLPSSLEQTVIIALGTRHGLHRDQVVRTAEGLLGKIIEVGPLSAKVRLLTDPDSGVGAVVGAGKAFGILKGVEEGQGKLKRRYNIELVHLDKMADVKPGDMVATSGQGGIFPPGIPIGIVESVREDQTHLVKIARIRPNAPQPGMVREVLVLAALQP